MQRLEGKVAVITGAASGVGRAAALLFAREGASVVVVDVNAAGSAETVKLIGELDREALSIPADVAQSDQVQRVADECSRRYQKVDVLFANAGKVIRQRFEDTTEDTWAEMIGVNLTGVFLAAKHLLPLLKASGRASIVNHASIDAILGNPHIPAYSAAKGGIIPLTHTMAANLSRYGIRVNCISSGAIQTPLSSGTPSFRQNLIAATPLGRFGTPEEVANLALFLASDESSYVNGANIVIDGGRTGITQGTI